MNGLTLAATPTRTELSGVDCTAGRFPLRGLEVGDSSSAPVAKTDKVLLRADGALASVWMSARVFEAQQESVLGLGLRC